jgi:hypothetical protein
VPYVVVRAPDIIYIAASASGRDAAGGAWRRGCLWREGWVRDDGIMSAAPVAAFAAALCTGVVRRMFIRKSRLLVVIVRCVFVAVGMGAAGLVVLRKREGGRSRRRWCGIHGQRLAMRLGTSRCRAGRYTGAARTTGRSCYITETPACPQERQDCGYMRNALSRPWEKVLGLALYTTARAKGWAPRSRFRTANEMGTG